MGDLVKNYPKNADINYKGMYNEWTRVGSFLQHNPVVYMHISVLKLAKHGLFYVEKDDCFVCFSCQKITSVRTYSPSHIRLLHENSCCLNNNKPIKVPGEDIYKKIQSELHKEYCDVPEHNHAASTETDLTNRVRFNDNETLLPVAISRPASNIQSNNMSARIAVPGMNSPALESSKNNYLTVHNRLATFKGWPPSAPVSAVLIAEAGFIYMGDDDKVKCVYCNGILKEWEDGDVPLKEHERFFPDCQFVRRNSSAEALQTKYDTIDSRYKTFKNWSHPAIKPMELSMAGLYSTGVSDNVKCFKCGIILNTWMPNADPFTEHAKQSPTCRYVIQAKGQDFIRNVLKTMDARSMIPIKTNEIRNDDAHFVKENCSLPVDVIKEYESETLKLENDKLRDERLCIVCLDSPKNILMLPCAHLACCSKCAVALQNCPVCRTVIKGTVKTFIS